MKYMWVCVAHCKWAFYDNEFDIRELFGKKLYIFLKKTMHNNGSGDDTHFFEDEKTWRKSRMKMSLAFHYILGILFGE